MKSHKILLGFVLKFFLIYVLLFAAAAYFGVDNMARDFYASTGQKLFKDISDEAEILGVSYFDKKRNTNVLFQIRSKEKLKQLRAEMARTGQTNANMETIGYYSNSRQTHLMPLILLLSLILAYPSSLLRKILPIIIGVFLLFLYIYFKLGCSLLYTIDSSEIFFPGYNFSSFTHGFLEIVFNIIVDGAYIVVALIWFSVCVRFEDFGVKTS